MRQWMVTLLLLLGCVILIVLHFVLFRSQLEAKVEKLSNENDALNAQLTQIGQMEVDSKVLIAQLPDWQRQLAVYQRAVPDSIEDEVFFGTLTEQLKKHNVELLGAQLNRGGSWLGEITEDQAAELEGIGVDVEAARQVKVAFYNIRLIGDWSAVLNAFEGLKESGRMYTIDEASSPAGGGGGSVTQVADASQAAVSVTGKIFYGLPDDKLSREKLREAIETILIAPKSHNVKLGVSRPVKKLVERLHLAQ